MKPLNPLVDQYLRNKLGENYQKDADAEYEDRLNRSNTGNLFSNLGDVISGQKVGSANKYFEGLNQAAKEDTVGKIDKARKEYGEDLNLQKAEREASQNQWDSEDSKAVRALIEQYQPGIKQKLGENFDRITAAQFPTIKSLYDSDRDFKLKTQQLMQDAALKKEALEEKKRLQAIKDQELSAQESKQLGLYKSGKLAEEMYKNATSDPNEYNPTNIGQWIDNSNWEITNALRNPNARAAQAAMSSWVEAYLRDASGAAIPPSERLSYAKDFFPWPGDDPTVVENKAKLRAQKMDNARIGAGSKAAEFMQPPLGSFPRKVKKDGNVATVSNDQELKQAQEEGWM